MAKKEETQPEDRVQHSEAAQDQPHTIGIRSRKAIMLREFIPSQEWIGVNIIGKGKGTKAMFGSIFGFVTDTETREATLPSGEKKPSIVCKGQFESVNHVTGEVSTASSVYFPEAFAQEIEAMFKMDDTLKSVKVDVDIGVEATGKQPPYTWIVIQHVDPAKLNMLTALRNERKRAIPSPLQLTHAK